MCECICHILGEVCVFGPKDTELPCCSAGTSINGAACSDGKLWIRITDPTAIIHELRKGDSLDIYVENVSALTNDSDVLAMMLPTEGMYASDDE